MTSPARTCHKEREGFNNNNLSQTSLYVDKHSSRMLRLLKHTSAQLGCTAFWVARRPWVVGPTVPSAVELPTHSNFTGCSMTAVAVSTARCRSRGRPTIYTVAYTRNILRSTGPVATGLSAAQGAQRPHLTSQPLPSGWHSTQA